ncbi:protein phosphatase 2C domain-containing protein [Streptomyces sp. CME 23]|nr:protein phosphatase 2C domain-containing protein [Streptomyces sp. CME 23]MCH5670273.1 protein phosphatase 2C domain-containing protein [Streptomyces sp. CME 23]
MSQQGGSPTGHEDDWWGQLYDDSTEDTGPTPAADTLDDRFASASGTVADGSPPGERADVVPAQRGGTSTETPTTAPTSRTQTGMNTGPAPARAAGPPPTRPPAAGSPAPPAGPPDAPAPPAQSPAAGSPAALPQSSAAGSSVAPGRTPDEGGPAEGAAPGPPTDGVPPAQDRVPYPPPPAPPAPAPQPPEADPPPTDRPPVLRTATHLDLPTLPPPPYLDVPASPPPLAEHLDVPASPPPLAERLDVPASPPPLAERLDVPASPPPLAERLDVPASPPPLAERLDVPASPPPPAERLDVPASPPPLAEHLDVPASPRPPAGHPDLPAPPPPQHPGLSAPPPVDRLDPSAVARPSADDLSLPTFPPPPADHLDYVGSGPPTYEPEPTALPVADPDELDDLVADTVLDGARYGACTLRAVSVRGDSARYRGEPRRDSLLTARFGTAENALILVAMATGARATPGAHRAAAEACHWIGRAVGRSHARLAEDIRAARRGDLKSGLHRLTDRSLGKLRASAAEQGIEPEEYSATLRCLLLPADPECRTRVFFGVGGGGLFRLRDGDWQDIEPRVTEVTGDPVVGFGSLPAETPEGDRLTMDLGIPTPPSPYEPAPEPPREPFRFRASVARPGDTLLMCTAGLADPLRGEPDLCRHLTGRWSGPTPPGLAAFLADTQVRVKGYADDRTAAAVWEA